MAAKKTTKPSAKTTKAQKSREVQKAPEATKAPKAPLTEHQQKILAKWQSLYSKAKSLETQPYNMKVKYEKETGIEHKLLGWGYIIDNKNDRLEVLFQDGIKYLISNYK
jgi:hypothetical protein